MTLQTWFFGAKQLIWVSIKNHSVVHRQHRARSIFKHWKHPKLQRTCQTTSITAGCVIQKWKWQHEPFFLFWSNNLLFLASDESQSTKPHRETQRTISDVNFWNVNSWLEAECPGDAATLRISGLRQWYKGTERLRTTVVEGWKDMRLGPIKKRNREC